MKVNEIYAILVKKIEEINDRELTKMLFSKVSREFDLDADNLELYLETADIEENNFLNISLYMAERLNFRDLMLTNRLHLIWERVDLAFKYIQENIDDIYPHIFFGILREGKRYGYKVRDTTGTT